MSRWIPGLLLLCASVALPADKPKERPKEPPPGVMEQLPQEEDESAVVKEYTFNPLQALKEIQTGNFYFKKGNYKAAAFRFREATKWNSGSAEAWLRLAEAEEKRKDRKAAHDAYAKYLELSPDAHNAGDIRKKLARLK
jgi:predicted Zn-dependent protease